MKYIVDPSLITKAQSGDTDSMTRLIEEVQNPLFKFCIFLTGNTQLANDLCQETLIKVLENINKVKDPESFRSWLFKTAKNFYLDHLKSPKNRAHEPIEELNKYVSKDTSPETLIRLREALVNLSPDERLVLLLVDLEEYSSLEAAQILDISERALRSRLHRARQNFISFF